MQRHSRTQFMYGNSIFRRQRSRIKPTGDQQINSPINWSNINGPIGEEVITTWQRLTGFTNTATIVISVEPNTGLTDAAGGGFTFVESSTQDFTGLVNETAINVNPFDEATTYVSVRPNNYYAFLAISNNDPVNINVTVSNNFGARNVIKIISITIE